MNLGEGPAAGTCHQALIGELADIILDRAWPTPGAWLLLGALWRLAGDWRISDCLGRCPPAPPEPLQASSRSCGLGVSPQTSEGNVSQPLRAAARSVER